MVQNRIGPQSDENERGSRIIESSQDRWFALRALIHYARLYEHGWFEEAVRSLIKIICFIEGRPLSVKEILKIIREQLKMDNINYADIDSQTRALVSEGFLGVQQGGNYKLEGSVEEELKTSLESQNRTEEQVKMNWQLRLQKEYPNLSVEELDILWNTLEWQFLHPLLQFYGTEVNELLKMGRFEKDSFVGTKDILEKALASLSPPLRDIARKEFIPFLEYREDKDREQFIASHFKYALAMRSMKMSKEEIVRITSELNQQVEFVILVDTNIIFSLLDLHETRLNDTVKFLVTEAIKKLPSNIKISYRVAEPTLKEFVGKIKACADDLSKRSWNPGLSRAILRKEELNPSLEGPYIAYHRSNSQGPVAPQAFFEPYSLIPAVRERLRKNFKIEIFNDPLIREYKTDQIIIDLAHDYRDYLKKKKPDKSEKKSDDSIYHDVLLVELCRRHRTTMSSFLEAKYFVLTIDFILANFEKQNNVGDVPVLIKPDGFISAIRMFLPDDTPTDSALVYSIGFVAAFEYETEPVTYAIANSLATWRVEDEDIAFLVLVDKAFRDRVLGTKTPKEVDKLVGERVGEEIEKLKIKATERDDLEKRVKELETLLKQTNEHIATAEKKLSEKEMEIKRESDLRHQSEMKLSDLDKKIREIEKREQEKQRVKEIRDFWLKCGSISILLIGVSSTFPFVLSLWISFPAVKFSLCLGLAALVISLWMVDKFGIKQNAIRDCRAFEKFHKFIKWLRGNTCAYLVKLSGKRGLGSSQKPLYKMTLCLDLANSPGPSRQGFQPCGRRVGKPALGIYCRVRNTNLHAEIKK